jgi:uncharacterized protein with HEPN domain
MPRRQWKLRIRHILDAIAKIRVYTAGMSLATFSANDLVVDAVLRNFMVIGEATRHIPTYVTTAYPQIPWRLMQDMRNVVVHDYPNVSSRLSGKPSRMTSRCCSKRSGTC